MRFCEEAQQNIHNNVYEMIRQQRKVVLHVYHKPMKRFVDTMKKGVNGKKEPLRKGSTERRIRYEKVSTGRRNRYEKKPTSMMK